MAGFKAIILAGGSGERFWPLSTAAKPKQFLKVFGDESLLRQSVSRLRGLVKAEDIWVITAKSLVANTRRELPEVPKAQIIGEPLRRDTGAAVALGVKLAAASGDEILGFFPADQLVKKPAAFRSAVRQAIRQAKTTGAIVTVGIKPTFPATTYGYVDPRRGVFVEKPNLARAKQYLKRGFLWNAGMFIASGATFTAAFARHAPELLGITLGDYPHLPRISFDYAVMEKFAKIRVVPGDFGWDDVGSFTAFERHFPKDRAGNVLKGEINAVECANCTAVAKGAKIALLGVKDLVVVTTDEAVLVVAKAQAASMKKLFAKRI